MKGGGVGSTGVGGAEGGGGVGVGRPGCFGARNHSRGDYGRGILSSTFQLNLSAVNGIGGARRDCVARVKGVLGGFSGV